MLAFSLALAAAAVAVSLWLYRALRQARAEAARLRLLAEHSVDAGWIIDCASGALLYASAQAQRLCGGAAGARLAAHCGADLPARIAGLLAGDEDCRRHVHGFGPDQPALEAVSTLVGAAGARPTLLVGVLRDVSAERAQQLAQKRFASMLSHEFRNPLTTIDGAIQRLEMTSSGADEGTRKRYHKIGRAVERLLALIDEYLTPERMAALGRTRAPDGLDLRALLEAAAAAGVPAGAPAGAPQHPLSVRCEGLPATLRCDPQGMRVCLEVLLDNACKYAPAASPIELVGQPAPEGGVELLVRDRGPGVAEDEIGRLFDKSFRGRNSGARPGSGLGLYRARMIVEQYGGTLTVRNRAAGGAAFRIWLPCAADSGEKSCVRGLLEQ